MPDILRDRMTKKNKMVCISDGLLFQKVNAVCLSWFRVL